MHRNTHESWHDQPISTLTAQLHTDVQHGLAPTEAAQRLQQDGPNALRQSKTVSPLALLAGQFGSLVIWVLIGAALVAAALGEDWLPRIQLHSPKITRPLTTEWFARRVDERYKRCLARAG